MLYLKTCACEACDLLQSLFFRFDNSLACEVLKKNIHGNVNLEELERRLHKSKVLQYRLLNGDLVLVDVDTNLVMDFIDLPPHYLEPSQEKK
jgi:hypothetical protein